MTEQKKFTVGMTRLAIVYGEVEVEAGDADEAAAKALEKHGEVDWEFDDLYDDGKPHSCVAISNVVDEQGRVFDNYDMSVMP